MAKGTRAGGGARMKAAPPAGSFRRGRAAAGGRSQPVTSAPARQRAKPPVGTPRKGQVARALQRSESNVKRAIAARDLVQGSGNRKINKLAAVAMNLGITKPGSPEQRKAAAAYERANRKISRAERTIKAANKARQRLNPLERATRGAYGPSIAKAKVKAGGDRSLLASIEGDRIKGASLSGVVRRGRARPSSKPTETTAARFGWIRGPKLQGVTRARLSGRQMSEGAGLRGKRRQARQERMGMMRQMLGRVKPGPSAEPLTTGKGTLAARTSLRGSRAKLAANPTPAQRGAVTRANRYANMAKASNRQALGQSPAGRLVRGKGRGARPANSIRRVRADRPAGTIRRRKG